MSAWSPRYVAYATAHGRTPEAMAEHDRAEFPGGSMAGFIAWIGERWTAYRAANKLHRDAPLTQDDHRAFDAQIEAA